MDRCDVSLHDDGTKTIHDVNSDTYSIPSDDGGISLDDRDSSCVATNEPNMERAVDVADNKTEETVSVPKTAKQTYQSSDEVVTVKDGQILDRETNHKTMPSQGTLSDWNTVKDYMETRC